MALCSIIHVVGAKCCIMSCFNASHVFTVLPRLLLLLQTGRTWGKSLNTKQKLLYFSINKGVCTIPAHTFILEKRLRAMRSSD